MKIDSIKAHDGASLRVARIEPATTPLGIIQIIHGFGEGLFHYKDVVSFFTKNGYICVIHDQRGFGEMPDLSPKQRKKARGVVPSYTHLLEDIKTLRSEISKWYPALPVILFGHSMGGNIAINYLIANNGYEKAIIEAPWLRLYKPLPKIATPLARLIGGINKNITVSANLRIEDITDNEDNTNNLRSDNIFHDRMSLRLYAAVVRSGENAIKNAAKISIPMLLLCPGMDKIVCPKAIREFAAGANKNVVLVDYPDGNHCLHSDVIKDKVLAEILRFCNK